MASVEATAGSPAGPAPRTRQQAVPVPMLRGELGLSPGAPSGGGAPTWIVHDRPRNRFYRIGERELVLMRHWAPIPPEALAERISKQSNLTVRTEEIENFARFLVQNQLVRTPDAGACKGLLDMAAAGRGSPVHRFFQRYLFFRVPLFGPQRFLQATLPFVEGAFGRRFAVFMGLVALLALVLLFRRWDELLANPAELWRPATLIWFFALLAVSKIIHEFAHGYALARAGAPVNSFGVAFLVLWPVLFTESSEAWKLQSRRRRVVIGAAGVVAETYLAIVALLIWSGLDEGPFRNALFMLGAFALTTTFAINMNPFMRFDGYYVLSDILDLPNMHARAFQHARWWIRRRIFGIDLPVPEPLPTGTRRFLIWFGVATWVYRAILFFAIALIVYSFFIKVVGIALFALEIWMLLVLPILGEVKVLRSMRRKMRPTWIGAAAGAVLLGLAFLVLYPFRAPVTVPAIAVSEASVSLYVETSARLAAVRARQGARVATGEVLFVFASPDLDYKIRSARHEIDILQSRLRVLEASTTTVDAVDVVRQRLSEVRRNLLGFEQEKAKLTVRAPRSGKLVDLAPNLRVGRWYKVGYRLAIVIEPAHYKLLAFVPVEDVSRLDRDAAAKFYPDVRAGASIAARLTAIEKTNLRRIAEPSVTDLHGGRVPVRLAEDKTLVPVGSTFRVSLRLRDGHALPARKTTGLVEIEAGRQSLGRRFSNWIVSVLIRESSF